MSFSDLDSDFEPIFDSDDSDDSLNRRLRGTVARVARRDITIDEALLDGLTDVVEQLLDEGLDPNTMVGNNPILILAAKYHKPNIVKLLLDRGADPNIRMLGGGETALFITNLHPDIIDSLLQYGADVNIKNDYGSTPLSHFAYLGIIPRIKLLVSKGADVNTTDNEGKTPLMRARNYAVVELLLRLGADPNIKDNYGNKASDYQITTTDYLSTLRRSILQMAEKRFSKKGILPSKPGRITPHWMEICNTLGNAGAYDLRKLIADNTSKINYDFVAQFFTSSLFDDVLEFLDYIQGLSKREICAGLAKYYTVVKPAFLREEVRRRSVRPISEMAREAIQSKRKKASLYSLAYRKARQADPEKFREHVSQLDLPNL
jgi:hypothetical protein